MSLKNSVTWCSKYLYLDNISQKLPSRLKISNFYLRDSCQNPESFNRNSNQRLHDTQKLKRNILPKDAKILNNELCITWSDDHSSSYSIKWIEKLFGNDRWTENRIRPTYWNNEVLSRNDDFHVSYEKVLNDKEEKKHLYTSLIKYGFVLVHGTPSVPESTPTLMTSISEVVENREYLDGKKFHVVEASSVLSDWDLAYSNMEIPFHTDNTDLISPAGLITFHIITHEGQGGESLLTDAFYSADIMQRLHKNKFETLCSLKVNHECLGDFGDFYHAAPIIQLNAISGEIENVRINEMNRSVDQPHIDQRQMDEWYDAFLTFNSLYRDPKNVFKRKLSKDVMMIADNWRIAHSRTAYTGKRVLIGCFGSRDVWQARARKLGLY